MISKRFLSIKGYSDVAEMFNHTTEYYISGKHTQARNNILAMSKPQIKEYFFSVLELYPDNKYFLEFIMGMI